MSSRKKPTYFTHASGYIMSGPCLRPHLDEALNFTPTPTDIFICTYPKCGTTWLQNILHLMRRRGQPLDVGQNINHLIPHIESDGVDVVENLPQPRVIKTHLPWHLLPYNDGAKYIYIARNPKDCCVSFYHHTIGFPKYYDFLEGTFNEFFELFLLGEVDSNDYFDHLLAYYSHRNDPNVLFLLYEDLKTGIEQSIKQIGIFLGGVFEESSQDSTILKNVILHSSFDSMKATPSMWSSERPEECSQFIRKGVIGDWKTYFSEEQSKLLDKKFDEKLSGTGAEHLWDKFDYR